MNEVQVESKIELTPGDVLLVEKPRFPGADENYQYMCIYDREYRGHVAKAAWRVGAPKLWYDPDWNIFEFDDDDVLDRLNNATGKHNELVGRLADAANIIENTIAPIFGDGELVTSQMQSFLEKAYRLWVMPFLKSEYETYMALYFPPADYDICFASSEASAVPEPDEYPGMTR